MALLQSRRYTLLTEIEERFQVSERTVFRDIKALEAAGVPMAFEKDRGYFIAEGHFLPPLAFTREEAKAFIFVDQLARKYTDQETYAHFSQALEKVKNKLRESQLEGVEELAERVKAYVVENERPQYLVLVEKACSEQEVLQLEYEDANGATTKRAVEPIGMTFYSQSWHLIAWCRLRKAYRDFSLSRVVKMEVTEENYSGKHLSLEDYIRELEKSQTD